MMELIPFKDFSDFTEELQLDGGVYNFNFSWNSRGAFWVLNIFAKDQTPILMGCKLVIDYELIEPYVDRPIPPGAILTLDVTSKLLRIGRNDMGDNVKLVYLTKAEKNALV